MKSRTVVALMPLSLLASCGLFGSESQGPAHVDDLVGWVERTYVESEAARENMQTAIGKLQVLVQSGSHDAVPAYLDYVAAVERAEQHLDRLGTTIGPMKDAAEPVFDRWEEDLEKFHSAEMRERSMHRRDENRARFETLTGAIDPAHEGYRDLVHALRDHALFLGNDFNPGSLAAVEDDIRGLTDRAYQIDDQFVTAMHAAREYVDSTALPRFTSSGTLPRQWSSCS